MTKSGQRNCGAAEGGEKGNGGVDREVSEPSLKGVLADPIDWFRISGAERLAAWRGLADFVEKLVLRYDLALEVLPCWWQHGGAVEELTALWQVRQFTYRDGAEPKEAMYWQDTLYKSRGRLRDIFVSCRDGHVDSIVGDWMSRELRMRFRKAMHDDCE